MTTIEPNPFVEYKKTLPLDSEIERIPKYKRVRKINLALSDETFQRLQKLALKYTGQAKDISGMLEQIGLYALKIGRYPVEIDEESRLSTEDFRQFGYEDGLAGNPQLYLSLYNSKETLTSYHEQYLRGYIEGSFIRNED